MSRRAVILACVLTALAGVLAAVAGAQSATAYRASITVALPGTAAAPLPTHLSGATSVLDSADIPDSAYPDPAELPHLRTVTITASRPDAAVAQRSVGVDAAALIAAATGARVTSPARTQAVRPAPLRDSLVAAAATLAFAALVLALRRRPSPQ